MEEFKKWHQQPDVTRHGEVCWSSDFGSLRRNVPVMYEGRSIMERPKRPGWVFTGPTRGVFVQTGTRLYKKFVLKNRN